MGAYFSDQVGVVSRFVLEKMVESAEQMVVFIVINYRSVNLETIVTGFI